MRFLALAGMMTTLALAAPSAASADPQADAAQLTACLDRAEPAARKDCIGSIANPCQDAPGGATTIGIVDCLAREEKAWDVLLNRYWPGMKEKARETDASNAEFVPHAPKAAEALLAAQRAWLAFREAECERAWIPYAGGTIRGPISASCALEFTAERAVTFYVELNSEF